MNHENGTYASLKLSKESAKKLAIAATKCGIDNIVPESEFHCTVVYSHKPLPELENWTLKLPTTASIKAWQIFPQKDKEEKALVLLLEAPKIVNLWKRIRKDLEATWDFDEYLPHITISTTWTSDQKPNKIPNIEIIFDEFEVAELI